MTAQTNTPATEIIETSLGDLISAIYEECLVLYGDEEQASLATAHAVNEILAQQQDN